MLDRWLVVLKPFLKKYGKAKRAEIDKVVGDHLSEKQLRRILDELRDKGKIKTQGQNRYMYYELGNIETTEKDGV